MGPSIFFDRRVRFEFSAAPCYQVAAHATIELQLELRENWMVMVFRRIIFVLLLAALTSGKAYADAGTVLHARLGISSYFSAIKPGAQRGQLDVPVVLVATSADRVTTRFVGSVPEPLSGEQLRSELSRTLEGSGESDGSLQAVLSVARTNSGEHLELNSLKFPAIILVRLEQAPQTPGGQALDASLDDDWEQALRDSDELKEGKFTLVIVSLDVSR